MAYLVLLYTSRASGASPLELLHLEQFVIHILVAFFFFLSPVPVSLCMMSESLILIKSAEGSRRCKCSTAGHSRSTEYSSFPGTSCRTSGQQNNNKPQPCSEMPPPLPCTVTTAWRPRSTETGHSQSPCPRGDARRSHLCGHFITWSL